MTSAVLITSDKNYGHNKAIAIETVIVIETIIVTASDKIKTEDSISGTEDSI